MPIIDITFLFITNNLLHQHISNLLSYININYINIIFFCAYGLSCVGWVSSMLVELLYKRRLKLNFIGLMLNTSFSWQILTRW